MTRKEYDAWVSRLRTWTGRAHRSSSPLKEEAGPAAQEAGAVRRDVLRLALPAMGEQMLSMMVGIVDTFLVGHLGAASLAAVGLANQWIFMATTLFGAIATGSTALIARYIGAREPEQANRVLRQSVLVAMLIGTIATLLGTLLARPAVLLLGAPDDVIDLSVAYLRVVASIFFFSTLMFSGNAAMRGAGDTRTPLYVMLVVNALNIVVAWTAINGPFGLPRLGVVGSALGAATGRLVGGLLVMVILLRGRGQIRLVLRGLRPDADVIRRILRIGLPTGAEQLLFRTGVMVFATILASLGTVAYAANQIAINIHSMSFLPGFGFAVAATTLVGQGLGAKKPEEAEKRGYTAYRLGAILMSAIGVIIVLFPAQLLGFFTNDAEVVATGVMPLRIVGLIQPLVAAGMIFAGGLRGAGDTRYPMMITGASIWLFRVPLAYLLGVGLGWGLTGAWVAMSADMGLRGTLNYLRYRNGGWKKIEV
ncbi:MAG TPA: MATE family efflux transporter [Anaerolineae bacterium]|nr:MATE family efflux transporter [Anaerolineae bacterium]